MNAYEILTNYACNPKRCVIARSISEAAEILSKFDTKTEILSIKLISNRVYVEAGSISIEQEDKDKEIE